MLKAMVDMVVYQRSLGVGDGFFHRLQLLRDLQAAAVTLQHQNDAFKMALRALEALDDFGVCGVCGHARMLSPWCGCGKSGEKWGRRRFLWHFYLTPEQMDIYNPRRCIT